jgi:hypothetical protein
MELRFKFIIFGFDTMLNYLLSQKLKIVGKSKFNRLIIKLTHMRGVLRNNLTCIACG